MIYHTRVLTRISSTLPFKTILERKNHYQAKFWKSNSEREREVGRESKRERDREREREGERERESERVREKERERIEKREGFQNRAFFHFFFFQCKNQCIIFLSKGETGA